MTRVLDWAQRTDWRAHGFATGGALVIVIAGLFGLIDGGDLWLRAFVSGIIFVGAAMTVIVGGRHVDRWLYAACCFISAGLMCSIPSLFTHNSPVRAFIVLAPVGFAILLGRAIQANFGDWRQGMKK